MSRYHLAAMVTVVGLLSWGAPAAAQIGRYQYIAKPTSGILLDTATGCIWEYVRMAGTKTDVFFPIPRFGVQSGGTKTAVAIPRECLEIPNATSVSGWNEPEKETR